MTCPRDTATAPRGPCSSAALTVSRSPPASPHLCRTSGTWNPHPGTHTYPDRRSHISLAARGVLRASVPSSSAKTIYAEPIAGFQRRLQRGGAPRGWGIRSRSRAGGLQSHCFIQSQTVQGTRERARAPARAHGARWGCNLCPTRSSGRRAAALAAPQRPGRGRCPGVPGGQGLGARLSSRAALESVWDGRGHPGSSQWGSGPAHWAGAWGFKYSPAGPCRGSRDSRATPLH